MRKALAISLEATKQPCHWMQQGRHEGVGSVTMILIPRWQLLLQGHQLPQCVRDKCKLHHFATQCRSHRLYTRCNDGNYCHHQHDQHKQHKLHNNGGCGNNKCNIKESLLECKDKGSKLCHLYGKHANHSHDMCHANPQNPACEQQQQVSGSNKKTQPPWHMHHTSRAHQLLDKQQTKLPGRASETIPSNKKTSASNNNKKYHLW